MKQNHKIHDFKNNEAKGIAFDLQKFLVAPYGEYGLYQSKIKCLLYILTVTDLNSEQGYYYGWNQTIAKWGATEIGSWLQQNLLDNIANIDITFVIFLCYFANCLGQNKNSIIHTVMVIATVNIKKIENF